MNQIQATKPETLEQAQKLCADATFYAQEYARAVEEGSKDAVGLKEKVDALQGTLEKSPFKSRLVIGVDHETMHVIYYMST